MVKEGRKKGRKLRGKIHRERQKAKKNEGKEVK